MSIRTPTRADCRKRLLRHKQELEFQLARVTAALEEGSEEEFAKAHHLRLGEYWRGEWNRPKLVQRKPGAAYHLDTKS